MYLNTTEAKYVPSSGSPMNPTRLIATATLAAAFFACGNPDDVQHCTDNSQCDVPPGSRCLQACSLDSTLAVLQQ